MEKKSILSVIKSDYGEILKIDDACFVCKWNGYEVWEPEPEGKEVPCVGMPVYYLVKGNKCDKANYNETLSILDSLPDEWDEN